MLFVLTEAAVAQQTVSHFGESERFVQLSVGQQPGVSRDLAPQKIKLKATVEIESQIPVLAVTHWVPLSSWHVPWVWRKSRANVTRFIWGMRVNTTCPKQIQLKPSLST